MKRLELIQKYLIEKDFDFLFINDPCWILYLTGLSVSQAKLYIGREKIRLFVNGCFLFEARKKMPDIVAFLDKENCLDFFLRDIPKGNKKMIFDSSTLTEFRLAKERAFFEEVEKKGGGKILFEGIDQPLKSFRMIKDGEEIASMRRSASLTWKGFEHVYARLKEGQTEEEVAWMFERYCRENGAQGMAFGPIVCFGETSAYPHYIPNVRTLKKNDIVLIDVGVIFDHYCSDMTRCVFFGEPNPELEKLYAIVKRAHAKALSFCRPGNKIEEVEKAARQVLIEEGCESLILHEIGHGVGLQIHEPPFVSRNSLELDFSLKPGMIFTIEPGLYKDGVGGVRYEDTILITSDGYENFYSIQ